MPTCLSYGDAVRLLDDGSNNRIVAALDRLAGGILLAAAGSGVGFVLSLFDPKAELVRLSNDLVNGLRERLLGSRARRSERIAAAHAVVVMVAYFETLREVELPIDVRKLELTSEDQIAASMMLAPIPLPAPQWPYEVVVESLRGFYEDLSATLVAFVAGLAVWDTLDETRRSRFETALGTSLPQLAVTRYEALFRRLAADFPEVAFWANLVDHQATRLELRSLTSGLAGVERALTEIASGRAPDHRRLMLTRAYQAELHKPILQGPATSAELVFPPLADAYVNPSFRSGQATTGLADESWWSTISVRHDLQRFLVGHLTSPQATQAPLLVLGQPGSGKSVLTQILAARLPPSEFLAVRVVLRDVPADVELQDQIERAVRAATGESVTWPEFVRNAGDALPVVLLDGFDELLQTTGVSQSDYLERVQRFQSREGDVGRPVAILVTSRTAVADRARPVPGMVAVRLEPFDKSHVTQWLTVWNAANASTLRARGLCPLAADSVFAHAQLASQPLLLLLLALYDADNNALQNNVDHLNEGELYERLLVQFAEREIRKAAPGLSPSQLAAAVDSELLHLAVVAFAMFNRRRQWVSEAELDSDLATVFEPTQTPTSGIAGLRAGLTAAQVVIGKFFFIHQAQAIRDDERLRTYEFLHATFGEYLIARLIGKELDDLIDTALLNTARVRKSSVDDSFLYALLSFAPLTIRETTVRFLGQRLQQLATDRRVLLRELLLEVFQRALEPRRANSFNTYEPVVLTVPRRNAAYSANLLLLVVLGCGEVTTAELFAGYRQPIREWQRTSIFWRSQLPSEGWAPFIESFTLHRRLDDAGERVVVITAGDGTIPRFDPYWSYEIKPSDRLIGWSRDHPEQLRQQTAFHCDRTDEVFIHALEPLIETMGNALVTFFAPPSGRPVSAANALIALWYTSGRRSDPAALTAAHELCLKITINGFAPNDTQTRSEFRRLYLHQLAVDLPRLPASWAADAINRLQNLPGQVDERSELTEMVNEFLGK